MPRAVFSFTNNTVDKEYNLADFKQLIRSGNNTIRMNCGWTYCYEVRSAHLTLLLKIEYFLKREKKSHWKDLEGLAASLHTMYVHNYNLKLTDQIRP